MLRGAEAVFCGDDGGVEAEAAGEEDADADADAAAAAAAVAVAEVVAAEEEGVACLFGCGWLMVGCWRKAAMKEERKNGRCEGMLEEKQRQRGLFGGVDVCQKEEGGGCWFDGRIYASEVTGNKQHASVGKLKGSVWEREKEEKSLVVYYYRWLLYIIVPSKVPCATITVQDGAKQN